jgi:hypothetical protein
LRPAAAVTFARSIGLTGAVACFAVAAAAGPEPDASIKTGSVEAGVFLDARIKADPGLAADCLAEGKKWIEKRAANAEAAREEDAVLFRDGSWSFKRKYTARSVVDGHYVSVVRSDYMNTGGRAFQFGRRHHPVGHKRKKTDQHSSLLHRDGR